MTAWINDLQSASYKGISFEVLSVVDSNQKNLAEHARPFVNGVDLEDMGTQARQIQISAVFYGAHFATDMQKLMKVLEEQGAGVLVHPIWGRMQNMIADSWSFRVEAEAINYAAIDITFREATEAQPIFVFENIWLTRLEDAINALNKLTYTILGYVDNIISIKNSMFALHGSISGVFSAVRGVYAAVRSLFDLDKTKYPDAGSYSLQNHTSSTKEQTAKMAEMISIGLNNEASQSIDLLPARQRYDATIIKNNQLLNIPDVILASQDDDNKDIATRQINKITPIQMMPVTELLNLVSVSVLIQIAIDLIERDSEIISINDLMHINNDIRQRIQARIDAIRTLYKYAEKNKSESLNALYTQSEQTIEALKQIAAQFNLLILALINQKPPLRVTRAAINGTIHQFAHLFYQDINRADELMYLNPHLIHPAFIVRGEWINYYAK